MANPLALQLMQKNNMVGIQDVENGPVKMVSVSQIKDAQDAENMNEAANNSDVKELARLDKILQDAENITNTGGKLSAWEVLHAREAFKKRKALRAKMDKKNGKKIVEAHSRAVRPQERYSRIGSRTLTKYDHDDFIDLAIARLNPTVVKDLEDILDGHAYADQAVESLEAIAKFAESKGEFKLSNDIRSHLDGTHPELKVKNTPNIHYVLSGQNPEGRKKHLVISAHTPGDALGAVREKHPTLTNVRIIKSVGSRDEAEGYRRQCDLMFESVELILDTPKGRRKKMFENHHEAKNVDQTKWSPCNCC